MSAENFQFLKLKNPCILHGHVFVMNFRLHFTNKRTVGPVAHLRYFLIVTFKGPMIPQGAASLELLQTEYISLLSCDS